MSFLCYKILVRNINIFDRFVEKGFYQKINGFVGIRLHVQLRYFHFFKISTQFRIVKSLSTYKETCFYLHGKNWLSDLSYTPIFQVCTKTKRPIENNEREEFAELFQVPPPRDLLRSLLTILAREYAIKNH